jgi:hypothetical protein
VGTGLIATIKDLISIGESYPASSRVLKKPDYYDIQFGKLLIPQVIVGDYHLVECPALVDHYRV